MGLDLFKRNHQAHRILITSKKKLEYARRADPLLYYYGQFGLFKRKRMLCGVFFNFSTCEAGPTRFINIKEKSEIANGSKELTCKEAYTVNTLMLVFA